MRWKFGRNYFVSRRRGMLWILWIIANEFPWRWAVDHLFLNRLVTIPRFFRILRKMESRYIALRFLIFTSLLCKSLSHSCNRTFRHSMDMRTFQDATIAKHCVSCRYNYYIIYNTSMQRKLHAQHLCISILFIILIIRKSYI